MRILDVGSGPRPRLVSDYSEIQVVSCDQQESPSVDPQDMESLTYGDNAFDVIICINALDHTFNAEKALKELLRVGRFVYINCAVDQRTRHHKKHYWDVKGDGRFVNSFANSMGEFDLKDYGFKIEFKDGRMIAKYV